MVHSPLGQEPCLLEGELSPEEIRKHLRNYFGDEPPASADIRGYKIWRGTRSGIVFAEPQVPGSAVFYDWLSSFKFYYPEKRWEYVEVATILRRMNRKVSVLDVGCGDGCFLSQVRSLIPSASLQGVDLSVAAQTVCRNNGISCLQGTVEDLICQKKLPEGGYDVVTAFHCLEHVSNPLEFLRNLLRLRKKDGIVAVSTPLSPMLHELSWFDIQNHPPHHLTRWNAQAYRYAAEILEQSVELTYSPNRNSLLKNWVIGVNLFANGPHKKCTKKDTLLNCVRTPRRNLRMLLAHAQKHFRPTEGHGSPDVLALLKSK